jgi:hypothetical protein
VVPGRIAAADSTAADVLAQLKPESRRMAPVGASSRHDLLLMEGPASVPVPGRQVVKPKRFTPVHELSC